MNTIYYRNFLGLFFLLMIAIAGCTSESKPIEKKEQIAAVKTTRVQKQTARYSLKLPGELLPFEEVQLYAKTRGFIQKLYVDRGSKVQKGQLLARLEAPEINQKYLAASAKQREVVERLEYSLKAYNRLKEASREAGAVAAIELEKAQAKLMSDSASYLALKAEMAAAAQLADYLEIRAPFDGVITERNVSTGALVGTQDKPLFTLAQQDRLRLTIAIPEKHVRAVSDSMQINYQLSNFPNQTFSARLSRSSKVLNKSLRSLMAEFDISNPDNQLSGGEYVQAEVLFQRPAPSLWVPSSSIVHAPSGVFVLKVEQGIIRRVQVEEGIRQDTLTEVFGSLQENDQIVVKGSEELREGTKIRVN
jgi:membrane fusion protein, multidrug efflux system